MQDNSPSSTIASSQTESTSAPIVFVVGNSRSGTTMMGRVLGLHPAIFTFKELHFFEELWQPELTNDSVEMPRQEAVDLFAKLLSIQRNNYYEQGKANTYLEEAAAALEAKAPLLTPPAIFEAFLRYEAAQAGKSGACDQTPRNVYFIEELLQLYDDATIVNMVRDPRAVMLSQKRKWRGKRAAGRRIPYKQIVRIWANYHPFTMALLWRTGIRTADQHKHRDCVVTVRFEDLVRQPQRVVQSICEQVGLEYDDNMLNVPIVSSSNRPNQTGSGIDPWVADAWREGGLTKLEKFICEKICHNEMAQYDYELLEIRPNPVAMIFASLTFVFKSALALLFNMGRVKNLGAAFKRRFLQ